MPQLTEDRRKEIVKKAHDIAEATRNAIRQARRDGNDAIEDQGKGQRDQQGRRASRPRRDAEAPRPLHRGDQQVARDQRERHYGRLVADTRGPRGHDSFVSPPDWFSKQVSSVPLAAGSAGFSGWGVGCGPKRVPPTSPHLRVASRTPLRDAEGTRRVGSRRFARLLAGKPANPAPSVAVSENQISSKISDRKKGGGSRPCRGGSRLGRCEDPSR